MSTATDAAPIRVVLADDHPMFRYGVAAVLADEPAITLVGQAATGTDLLTLVRDEHPDVVVTDMRMPDLTGIEVTRTLAAELPDLESSQRFSQGAFPQLTQREREVLDRLAAGKRNSVIARELSLSEKTVRNHLSSILAKLQVADRSAAIVRARQAGLGQ